MESVVLPHITLLRGRCGQDRPRPAEGGGGGRGEGTLITRLCAFQWFVKNKQNVGMYLHGEFEQTARNLETQTQT